MSGFEAYITAAVVIGNLSIILYLCREMDKKLEIMHKDIQGSKQTPNQTKNRKQ